MSPVVIVLVWNIEKLHTKHLGRKIIEIVAGVLGFTENGVNQDKLASDDSALFSLHTNNP